MSKEPTVLDYVKARLMPWKGPAPAIPPAPIDDKSDGSVSDHGDLPEYPSQPTDPVQEIPLPGLGRTGIKTEQANIRLPWRSISAVLLALIAQWSLEPNPNPDRWQTGVVLYLISACLLVWAVFKKEWHSSQAPSQTVKPDQYDFRMASFLAAIMLLAAAYLSFGKPFNQNLFTLFNTSIWIAGLVLAVNALWLRKAEDAQKPWISRLFDWLRQPKIQYKIDGYHVVWLVVLAVAVFFRTYQLEQVPAEMNSDHAEKLLDVVDVLNGQYKIFFPRNTGREPIQFYLIALTGTFLKTGVSFLSMKIGTALAGILTLPFIYKLGKEISGRRLGLIAMAFAGIAYWPIVLSRVALRFSLYPLFAAPMLFYLIRGLRSGNRNDYILSGLALGFGLLGYTPIRILPFAAVIVIAIFLLDRSSANRRWHTLFGLILIASFTLFASIPLVRFAQDNPDAFAYRAFSRLFEIESPLPDPAGIVFLKNLVNAMLMFGWNDGLIWPVSIPGRPALDVVSAAFFHLGLILLLLRFVRRRNWIDLALIISIPLLMLPSILSLAFPGENPAPNRAGGAIVPVFLIVALGIDGFMNGLQQTLRSRSGKWTARLIVLGLFLLAGFINFDLVFRQYANQYSQSAWNSSEMGGVIRNFSSFGGSMDASWVVKSPHWVDTRLVGIHAGEPSRDFGIDIENLINTTTDPRAKIFLIRHQPLQADQDEQLALDTLQTLYPTGWAALYPSQYADKDFWMFIAPPMEPGIQGSEPVFNQTP